MELSAKRCIISCGVGGWYARGIERLERSLIYHGFSGDMLFWKGEYPPGSPTHEADPYAFKVYAFKEAVARGYTQILWLDASAWAVRNPDIIFDEIASTGYYLWKSGFNCAQTCNDILLQVMDISRDQAETMQDISSGAVGLFISNPTALTFLNRWEEMQRQGLFKGSRQHAGQSKDPRFLFFRQDQSCGSIIAAQLGMKLHDPGVYTSYYPYNPNRSVIFFYRGM